MYDHNKIKNDNIYQDRVSPINEKWEDDNSSALKLNCLAYTYKCYNAISSKHEYPI